MEDLGVQSSEDDEKVQIEATTSSTSEEVQIEATSSSTSEEVASDDAVGAKERNGRWKDREPGQIIENLPFSVGDVVLGKVVFSNINGSRIEIMCDVPGIFG